MDDGCRIRRAKHAAPSRVDTLGGITDLIAIAAIPCPSRTMPIFGLNTIPTPARRAVADGGGHKRPWDPRLMYLLSLAAGLSPMVSGDDWFNSRRSLLGNRSQDRAFQHPLSCCRWGTRPRARRDIVEIDLGHDHARFRPPSG